VGQDAASDARYCKAQTLTAIFSERPEMQRLTIILIIFLLSCGTTKQENQENSIDSVTTEIKSEVISDEHPNIELKLDTIVQSIDPSEDSLLLSFINLGQRFNTFPEDSYQFLNDDPNTQNIKRPSRTYIKMPKYPLKNLFGVWGGGKDEPVSDFRIDSKIFDVADYDGESDMPYILYNDSIIVFYNDFIRTGKIILSTTDSLTIRWKNLEGSNDHEYIRWK
jgi:hypothetical protein